MCPFSYSKKTIINKSLALLQPLHLFSKGHYYANNCGKPTFQSTVKIPEHCWENEGCILLGALQIKLLKRGRRAFFVPTPHSFFQFSFWIGFVPSQLLIKGKALVTPSTSSQDSQHNTLPAWLVTLLRSNYCRYIHCLFLYLKKSYSNGHVQFNIYIYCLLVC